VYAKYKLESYTAMVRKILGKRHYYIINFVIFFDMTTSSIIFVYFSAKIISLILNKYNVFLPHWLVVVVVLLICCVVFVLSFFDLQKISVLSYIGNFFAFYISVILLVQMYSYYERAKHDLQIKYFDLNLDVFKNLGIAFYGYVNQFAIVKIFKEIRNANKIGFVSITFRSLYPPMLLYTLVLFAGYISFGAGIPEFIVLRQAPPGSLDISMTIGQFGILLTMMLGLIIRVQSNSNIVQYFLKTAGWIDKKPNDKISRKANVTIAAILTFVPGVIAILIQTNISNYVSLFSSLVCPYYILIAPCKP